jgi:hypothetical protein
MTDEAAEDETEKQQRRRLHDAQRSELLDRQRANSDSYDKAILTLASGSLALSLSFIKDILPASSVPAWTGLLYASWILLTLAIISTVASYLFSNAAINQALVKNTEYYLEEKEAALAKTKLSYVVDASNLVSGILFILGIALTVAFVSINFHEVRNMKTADTRSPYQAGILSHRMQKVATGSLEKGQPIPQMQPVVTPAQTVAPQSATNSSAVPAPAAVRTASPSTPEK